jgi:hypothetical protein
VRRALAFAFTALIALRLGAEVSDPVGSLIDSEKEQEQKWLEEPHEVPPAFLWGDARGVEIDNPRAIENPTAMCSEIAYDQWLGLADEPSSDGDMRLNTISPRSRDLLSETCLMRPGDRVLAIGEGWQKEMSLNTFVLRKSATPCPEQFPYALWGKFDAPLPDPPLFFTTQLDFGERNNAFAAAVWSNLASSNTDTAGLRAAVAHTDDYLISISSLSATNVDALYFLERRSVTLEDNDLPYNLLAACKRGQCETLWLERVNERKGSGHLHVVGTLDFNGDGRRDLLLQGDNAGCPYRKIFMGLETGFSPMESPLLACAC